MKLNWSDVTPKALWSRRGFLVAGAAFAVSPALALTGKPSEFSTDEAQNTLE